MDSDVTTVQRARGWRECPQHDDCNAWVSPDARGQFRYPDPLADTPEGWYEFGQILKWAHERGWRYCVLTDPADGEQAIQFFKLSDPILLPKYFGWTGPDFRTAIIAALAAAVRPESEATG